MILPHLIVEGIDRTGKSTFIDEYCRTFPTVERLKAKVHEKDDESILWYLEEFFKKIVESKNPIIFDRGHISEIVYSTLYRPNNYSFTKNKNIHLMLELEELFFKYSTRPVILLLLMPGNREILLPDLDRPNADREKELQLFMKWYMRSSLSKRQINVHKPDGHWKGNRQTVTEYINSIVK